MTWHVAYTAPREELRIASHIRDTLGYAAYAPLECTREVHRGRLVDAAKPLFPRYLFVHGQSGLRDVRGVADVLDGHVPDAWVVAMQKAEGCGMFDHTRANASRFKVGETVRISEGPFSGFNATIQEFIAKLRSATATKRAKLLVSFMGRMSAVELDVTAIEKL